MAQQTAVEWLVEQLLIYGDKAFNKEISLGQYHIKKQELIKQAKQMEKEQMIKFADNYVESDIFYCSGEFDIVKGAEQYYNETYGKE